jgi:hypothetical protein
MDSFTFEASDTLPEDSPIREFLLTNFGTITLKTTDQSRDTIYYCSDETPPLVQFIKYAGYDYYWFSVKLNTGSFCQNIDKSAIGPDDNAEICAKLFSICINLVDKDYPRQQQLRIFPIYQMLETMSISGSAIDVWKGFTAQFIKDNPCKYRLQIEYKGSVIYLTPDHMTDYISVIVRTLKGQMEAGTADRMLYTLPISNTKSARNY